MNGDSLLSLTVQRVRRMLLSAAPGIGGVASWVGVWYVLSLIYPTFLLPSPVTTLFDTAETLISADFWENALVTLRRSTEGLLAAFVCANITAYICATSSIGKKILWPVILIGNAFPGIIATFVAVVVFGSYGPVAVTVEIALLSPLLFFVLYPAYEGISETLREVAVVFRVGKVSYLRTFVFPQLAPAIFASLHTGFSNGWKLVVTAEVFTLGGGVGYRILQYFNQFSLRHVFAWIASFLLIIFVVEYGILAPLERMLIKPVQPEKP